MPANKGYRINALINFCQSWVLRAIYSVPNSIKYLIRLRISKKAVTAPEIATKKVSHSGKFKT